MDRQSRSARRAKEAAERCRGRQTVAHWRRRSGLADPIHIYDPNDSWAAGLPLPLATSVRGAAMHDGELFAIAVASSLRSSRSGARERRLAARRRHWQPFSGAPAAGNRASGHGACALDRAQVPGSPACTPRSTSPARAKRGQPARLGRRPVRARCSRERGLAVGPRTRVLALAALEVAAAAVARAAHARRPAAAAAGEATTRRAARRWRRARPRRRRARAPRRRRRARESAARPRAREARARVRAAVAAAADGLDALRHARGAWTRAPATRRAISARRRPRRPRRRPAGPARRRASRRDRTCERR